MYTLPLDLPQNQEYCGERADYLLHQQETGRRQWEKKSDFFYLNTTVRRFVVVGQTSFQIFVILFQSGLTICFDKPYSGSSRCPIMPLEHSFAAAMNLCNLLNFPQIHFTHFLHCSRRAACISFHIMLAGRSFDACGRAATQQRLLKNWSAACKCAATTAPLAAKCVLLHWIWSIL